MTKSDIQKKISKSAVLLHCVFALLIACMCFLAILPDFYFIFNIAVVGLLFLYYFLSNKFKVKIIDLVVLVLALIQIGVTFDVVRISIFVFYLFLRSTNLYSRAQLQKCVLMMVLFLAMVLVAYSFGFNQQYDKLSWSPVEQVMIAEKALGFTNANRCMFFFFCLSSLILLLTDKIRYYLLILLANAVLYSQTKSRTFYYALIGVVAVLLILKFLRMEKKRTLIAKLAPFSFLLFLVLSFVLPMWFSDTYLNVLFTGRLAMNKSFLATGLTFFGNSALESATFDSSYLHMLLTKGVIYFVVFSVILLYGCIKSKMNNKRAVILCSIFLVAFMEVIFLESFIMLLIGVIVNMGETEIKNES